MIGFIVEGKSDVRVMREICRKLSIAGDIQKMDGNDLGKAKTLAERLLETCEKVIVLKDRHQSDPKEIRRRFKEEGFRNQVKLCIVNRTIETWLLADEKAIGDYLRTDIEEIPNPEDIDHPAEFLDEIFKRKKGRSYHKEGTDPQEIARRLDLRKLERRCPSFRYFKRIIQIRRAK